MIIKQDYGTLTGGELAVESIIAPVQKTLTAEREYAAGAYFIYDDKMYKATSAITAGSAIVLSGSGANATPGGTVMEQNDNFTNVIKYLPSMNANVKMLITHEEVTFESNGYGQVDVSSYIDSGKILCATVFAVMRNTEASCITGANANDVAKLITLRAWNNKTNSVFSGATRVNIIFFELDA